MKKYIFIATATLLLSACNQKELADSNRDKDSLISIVNERDSTLNNFIASFNEVENTLNSVSEKQHIIAINSAKPGEMKSTQKDRINDEIMAINNLMDENRKKIADLNRRVKNSLGKNAELEKLITTLNDQLSKKDLELSDLNARLLALNAQVAQLAISVDTLTTQNGALSQTIAEDTRALHTAYFVIGKSSELQDAKIIDRKGGLLGIGKTSKLSGDFDNSKFTRIDYTVTSSIAVNSDMKIITSHPTSSYTLDTDAKNKDLVKNLVITNPEMFWSASKYLVIVKD